MTVSWIITAIGNLITVLFAYLALPIFDFFVTIGSSILMDTDLSIFAYTFPFAGAAFKVITVTGITVVVGLFIWEIYRNFLAPITETEPIYKLAMRAAITLVVVAFSFSICNSLIKIAQVPYQQLLTANVTSTGGVTSTGVEYEGITTTVDVEFDSDDAPLTTMYSILHSKIQTAMQVTQITEDASEVAQNWSEGKYWAAVCAAFVAVGDALFGASQNEIGNMICNIISLLVTVAIAKTYIKLVLEGVQRYVTLGVLSFLSPLPLACGATKGTSNVSKSFIRMYVSQLILIFLNVWFIYGVNAAIIAFNKSGGLIYSSASASSVGSIAELIARFTASLVDGSAEAAAVNARNQILIFAFLVLGFEKIGLKVDSYMASLGLGAAVSGSSMMDDLKSAFGTVASAGGLASSAMRGTAGAVFGKGGIGNAGNVLSSKSRNFGAATGEKGSGILGGFANAAERSAIASGRKGISAETLGSIVKNGAANGKAVTDAGLNGAVSRSLAQNISGLGHLAPQVGKDGNVVSGLKNAQVTKGGFSAEIANADGTSTAITGRALSPGQTAKEGERIMTAADGTQFAVSASGPHADQILSKMPDFGSGGSVSAKDFAAEAADSGISDFNQINDENGQPVNGAMECTFDDGSTGVAFNRAANGGEPDCAHESFTDNDGSVWDVVKGDSGSFEMLNGGSSNVPDGGISAASLRSDDLTSDREWTPNLSPNSSAEAMDNFIAGASDQYSSMEAVGLGQVECTDAGGNKEMLFNAGVYGQDARFADAETVTDSDGRQWFKGKLDDNPVASASGVRDINMAKFNNLGCDYQGNFPGKEIRDFDTTRLKTDGYFDVYNSDHTMTRFHAASMYQPSGKGKLISTKNGDFYVTEGTWEPTEKVKSVRTSNGKPVSEFGGMRIKVTSLERSTFAQNNRSIFNWAFRKKR